MESKLGESYRVVGKVRGAPRYDSMGVLHFSLVVERITSPDNYAGLVGKTLKMSFEGNNTSPSIRNGERIGVYFGAWVRDLETYDWIRSLEITAPKIEILDKEGEVSVKFEEKDASLAPHSMPFTPREM